MRPEQVVERKNPTVGETPTGNAAGLGVTPADAASIVKEIRETAERMSELAREMLDLAERVYQKLREVQRFIAEERRLASERNWILLDKRIQRSFECAVTILYAMMEVEGIMKRLAEQEGERG
jgi:hypothetical protein